MLYIPVVGGQVNGKGNQLLANYLFREVVDQLYHQVHQISVRQGKSDLLVDREDVKDDYGMEPVRAVQKLYDPGNQPILFYFLLGNIIEGQVLVDPQSQIQQSLILASEEPGQLLDQIELDLL